MMAGQFLGGKFEGHSASKFSVNVGLLISRASDFQINNMPVYLNSNVYQKQKMGLDAPGVAFKELHIDGNFSTVFFSSITTQDLYWEWAASGVPPRNGLSNYCNPAYPGTNDVTCSCQYDRANPSIADKINGRGCALSTYTDNNGFIDVTGDLYLKGGGGDYLGSGVSMGPINSRAVARIRMSGGSNSKIEGRPDSDPNWGILPEVHIAKDSNAQQVQLVGKIPFVKLIP
jgi:hypothetical protein